MALVTRFDKEELDLLAAIPEAELTCYGWAAHGNCSVFYKHKNLHPGCEAEIQTHYRLRYDADDDVVCPCYMRHGEYVLKCTNPMGDCKEVFNWLEATCPYPKVDASE